MSAPSPAVFLSYASQDAETAERIADALRAIGIEVWFDKNELVGGDAWDAKIRKQISSCTLFLPILSANTQARAEGYFRLEWKLAADRTHLMADDHPFLFPVVIDGTTDTEARVPEPFRERQWMRLNSNATPETIAERLASVLANEPNTQSSVAGVADPGSPSDAPGSTIPVTTLPAKKHSPALMIGAVAAVLIGIATAAWFVSQSKIPLEDPLTESTPPASEVDEILATVRQQLSDPNLGRADLEAAGRLIDQAIQLDESNANVWAAAAAVHNQYLVLKFDRSPARLGEARDHVIRALQLDPGSYEARLVQVQYWARSIGDLGNDPQRLNDVEISARALLKDKPNDVRVIDVLAFALSLRPATLPEALQLWERATADHSFAPQALMRMCYANVLQGEFAQADHFLRRSLAIADTRSARVAEVLLSLHWNGDLDAAKAVLDRMPQQDLQDEIGGSMASWVHDWRGEPAVSIRYLDNMARDWISSQFYEGPTDLIRGDAHRQAGQINLARRAYRRALPLLDEQLVKTPNSANVLINKAWVLHHLGDEEEAQATYDVVREMKKTFLPVDVALESPDQLFSRLEAQFESTDNERLRWVTAATLRHGYFYDPIRDHPRFQALLARAEASPRHTPNPKSTEKLTASSIPPKSIAVLAFENRSADADNEYFSDGISEELLNVLTKVEGLKVTSRTSAFHFKGKDTPIREIGRQLGVAYVVEGSVRRAGDRVRITTQLIKADDGFNVWSQSFDRDLKDIFALQDEIAGLVAEELQLKLGFTSLTREVNPEAYGLYSEARHLWNQRGEDNFVRAEAALDRALELDPDFAEAHATLADVWAMRATYWSYQGKDDTSEEIAKTRASANHALSLNPDLSRPYSALGWACMLEGKWEEARRWHLRAVERSPRDATTRFWYGSLLGQLGEITESEKEIQIAAELDPLSFIITLNLGFFGYIRQDWEESYTYYRKGAELREGSFVPAQAGMAHSAYRLGRTEEAVRLSREVLASWPELPRFSADQFAVWVLHQSGHETEAEAFVDRVLPEIPPRSYLRGFLLAAIGRWEEALPNFETTPYSARGWVFDSPILDPWREDPRFIAMIDRWGETERYQRFRAAMLELRKKPITRIPSTEISR